MVNVTHYCYDWRTSEIIIIYLNIYVILCIGAHKLHFKSEFFSNNAQSFSVQTLIDGYKQT